MLLHGGTRAIELLAGCIFFLTDQTLRQHRDKRVRQQEHDHRGCHEDHADDPCLQRCAPLIYNAILQTLKPIKNSCGSSLFAGASLAGLIANATDGQDDLRVFRIVLDLGAQTLHVHIDETGIRSVAVAPDGFQ